MTALRATWFECVVEHRLFLPTCFLTFVVLRLATVALVSVVPSSDAAWYFSRAVTLSQTWTYSERGIPTAYWPVGYPGMLGLLFSVTGPSLGAAKAANLLFAAISFWCLYFLVRGWLGDERTARASVLLLAVYPNNIAYAPLILTEYFFTALLLGGALLCILNSRFALVAAGVLFGIATLVKTQTILLAPILVFALRWRECTLRGLIPASRAAVAATVIALCVIAPWTWRNYQTFGSFVLVSTNGGMSLLAGNNPSTVGDYSGDFNEADPLVAEAGFSVADQVGADHRARALALGWIRANPGAFLSLVPKKVFRLWAPDGEAEWQYQAGTPWYDEHWFAFRAIRLVNQAYYVAALALFGWAFFRLAAVPATPDRFAGYVFAAAVTAVSIVFSGQSRYHFPVMPFVFAYGAWMMVGNGRTSRCTWSLKGVLRSSSAIRAR